jgi:hypothetical protein
MFARVYNLVRLVILDAAGRQKVPINRISFIDALRWLCHRPDDGRPVSLIVLPSRLGRVEPRGRPKQYPQMRKPCGQLK